MNNVKKYVIIISMIFFVVIGIVLIRNAFLVQLAQKTKRDYTFYIKNI